MLSSFRRTSRDKEKKEKTLSKSRVSSTSSTGGSNSFTAPNKVIQAIYPYVGQKSGELSFDEGQFFHVIGDFDKDSQWTQANDPIKDAVGIVPTAYFKVFEKTHKPGQRTSSSSSTGSSSVRTRSTSTGNSVLPKKPTPLPVLYGRLLYDFAAERPDELNCEVGDSLIICAHHDYEWFIGKFMEKIGEPGLVPVGYVQLFDTTGRVPLKDSARDIIDKHGLPKVDEWKAITNRHKASAKAVGSAAVEQQRQQQQQQNYGNSNQYQELQQRNRSVSGSSVNKRSSVYVYSVDVETFSLTDSKYWFLVHVVFSNGTIRKLCRYYEDFFNFHQIVLSTWPREAGKFGSRERVIPYIPGPLQVVTDLISHQRLSDLDQYLKDLLQLDDYISKSDLVLGFFDLREGDVAVDQYSEGVPVQALRVPPPLIFRNGPEGAMPADSTRHSQYQQDRMSQYENVKPNLSNRVSHLGFQRQASVTSTSSSVRYANGIDGNAYSNEAPSRNGSTKKGAGVEGQKFKIKFYYKDDIFAIVLSENCSLEELKRSIIPRIDESEEPGIENRVRIFPKNDYNVDQYNFRNEDEIHSSSQLHNISNFTDKGKLLIIVG